jgi:hypothetical protein
MVCTIWSCTPSAVDSNLRVAQLATEFDQATVGRAFAGPILDASSADAAEIIVVDARAVGHQELDDCVVEVEVDVDVARFDP